MTPLDGLDLDVRDQTGRRLADAWDEARRAGDPDPLPHLDKVAQTLGEIAVAFKKRHYNQAVKTCIALCGIYADIVVSSFHVPIGINRIEVFSRKRMVILHFSYNFPKASSSTRL